jgi:uncharacterized protein (DUF58 family)
VSSTTPGILARHPMARGTRPARRLRALARLRRRLRRWLLRKPHAEPSPIVLDHRRIFVLPTAAGHAYAGALLVMLIASINYNLALGYGLVFVLSAIGFVSIVHTFRNLLRLVVRAGRSEPVFAGEPARFSVLVDNPHDTRHPCLRLRLRRAATTNTFSLAARHTAALTLSCPTHRRGWLQLERVVLDTVWPLGLIRAWSVFAPDMRCLVYPAPEAAPPPLPDGPASGIGQHAVQRGDDDFSGLRAHQAGDSPRHVAWKVLARDGPMLTKHFSGLAGGELRLDWDALPPQLDTEARIARLAAWVLAAQAHGRPFALCLPDGCGPAGAGARHVHDCLMRLALYAPGNDDDD